MDITYRTTVEQDNSVVVYHHEGRYSATVIDGIHTGPYAGLYATAQITELNGAYAEAARMREHIAWRIENDEVKAVAPREYPGDLLERLLAHA